MTVARRLIRDHRAQRGEAFSFTSFIVGCLARAVALHPVVQGYLYRGRVVVFDDVDVVVIAEVPAGEFSFPLAHVVRDAGNRSTAPHPRRGPQTPERRLPRRRSPLVAGPGIPVASRRVRRAIYALLLRNPHRRKKYMGTVAVTALGMYGDGEFWGIALPQHNLQLVVGGIAEKPAMVDGEVRPREFCPSPWRVNHDVVDGGPATRFANDLKRLIESADGLAEALAAPRNGTDGGQTPASDS